jgi:hypothetical protein
MGQMIISMSPPSHFKRPTLAKLHARGELPRGGRVGSWEKLLANRTEKLPKATEKLPTLPISNGRGVHSKHRAYRWIILIGLWWRNYLYALIVGNRARAKKTHQNCIQINSPSLARRSRSSRPTLRQNVAVVRCALKRGRAGAVRKRQCSTSWPMGLFRRHGAMLTSIMW